MRVPGGFGRPGSRLVAIAVLLSAIVGPGMALAGGTGTTISGSATGRLSKGSVLRIEMDAFVPGGWQKLDTLTATLLIGDQVGDVLSFNLNDQVVSLGKHVIFGGTEATASGRYLGINGQNVVVATGGIHLLFVVRARVISTIPQGARFRMEAVDDLGAAVSTIFHPTLPKQPGGITWSTAATFIAVAVFAGGFIGNLMAGRRRPKSRMNVYGTMQRRMEEERASKESSSRT